MKRTWMSGLLAALGLAVVSTGCASTEVPVRTGYLSTYANLVQVSEASWRYRDPNNRLARYGKFLVRPVELALPEGAKGSDTPAEDLNALKAYMHDAVVRAITASGRAVVDYPGGDVAEIRMALTDAYDKSGHVGIAVEAEMIDSVSSVQIGAVVESQKGKNLTINNAWREHDAKAIVDGWAGRIQDFIASAK